jgi:alanine racemase
MSRNAPAWIEINVAALRRNAERLIAHSGRPLAPVLKADAYGLGAVAVAEALEPLQPWGYCVATLDEAAQLRAHGVSRPLLVCPPLDEPQVADAVALGVRAAIGRPELLQAWRAAGGEAWHLAVDTGMLRAGARWDRLHAWRDVLRDAPPEGVFTHFHSADVADDTMADQEHRFAAALAELPSRPPLVHTDNSAAAARRPAGSAAGSFSRAGLFLYGVGTGPTAQLVPEPVVSVRARIVEVHEAAPGDTVGYLGAWTAPGPRRIATIPVGYADGYRRGLGNRGAALLRGQDVPIAGWVTMDMTMLDVTAANGQVGDVVTLVGADASGRALRLEDLATVAGCSPYELLVSLKLRLPHRVVHT